VDARYLMVVWLLTCDYLIPSSKFIVTLHNGIPGHRGTSQQVCVMGLKFSQIPLLCKQGLMLNREPLNAELLINDYMFTEIAT